MPPLKLTSPIKGNVTKFSKCNIIFVLLNSLEEL
jgi:hypothetical protein